MKESRPSPEPATVFVVDDNMPLRRSIARLMQSEGLHVETFASADQFLKSRPSGGPACIVLDVCMSGLNGLEMQEKLTSQNIDTPIIFLTAHGDIPMSVRAIKQGAADFLTKPVDGELLLKAVRLAIQRHREQLASQRETEGIQGLIRTLTPREHQVFRLVVTGMLNKEIAAELGISEKTVKIHRGRVMEKLRVTSLAELVRLSERAQAPAQQSRNPEANH